MSTNSEAVKECVTLFLSTLFDESRVDIYILVKGVFGRFGFDGVRISQVHRQVKNKATGTPQGMYYIQPSLASDAKSIRW